MMAPKYERLSDIQTVLGIAASALDGPIDRIEYLAGGSFLITAGARVVEARLEYGSQTGSDGEIMPGSPSRSCVLGTIRRAPTLFQRLRRLVRF